MSTQPDPNQNPYAAPSVSVDEHDNYGLDPMGGAPLATRGSRLAAYLLDGAVGMVAALPIVIPMIMEAVSSGQPSEPSPLFLGLFGVILMGVAGVNLYLLHQNGQSIGKKIMDIKIVRSDRRTRASLPRIIFLRYFPIGLLGAIPFLGPLIQLADPLFIFRDDQRCLHDLIGDTNVIVADSGQSTSAGW